MLTNALYAIPVILFCQLDLQVAAQLLLRGASHYLYVLLALPLIIAKDVMPHPNVLYVQMITSFFHQLLTAVAKQAILGVQLMM